MKTSRLITYKKVNRAAYLLGIVFLLAGMFLSMVSQPAQASTLAKPTRGSDPVVRTPEGPLPDQPTQPPSHDPDQPGVPGNRVPGRNSQSFNFSNPGAPNVPTPPVRLLLSSGSVRFTQSNYCLSQPGPGWVEATAVVTIPEGETAILQTNWYIVHPNPYPDDPTYNDVHYEQVPVTNGQPVTWQAWWPGASLYDPSNSELSTIEIHWGAQLIDPDTGGPVGTAGSLDAYFNGRCDARPELTISHQCVVGGGIQWTAHNAGNTAVPASYSVTGGTSGTVTVPANGSTVLDTTSGGAHTATISWDNGVGGTGTATDSSVAGECQVIPSLTVSHACGPNGIVFTASNPNAAAITFDYTAGTLTGSATAPAGGSVDFLTLPAGTAHTVNISWPDGTGGNGTATDSSTAEECGTVALVLSHQCSDTGIVWSLFNPGTAAVSYQWNLDSNTLTGTGSVGAGQTVTVTETSGGAHQLEVTWTGGSTTDTSSIGECGTTTPSLTISRQCVEGGGIQWSVTNTGTAATNFTWNMDSGTDSGSGSVNAGQTVVVTTTTGGGHLLIVTYGGNSTSDQSGDEECGGSGSLSITFQCVEGGGIQWRVTNVGETALSFTWNLDNGSMTGTGSAPAGGSTNVVVSTGGVHSLSISWSGGSTSASSTAEDCGTVQPVVITLDWQCSEDNSGVEWVAINNNDVAVSFSWSLDGGASTNASVPANSRYVFHTVSGHNSHDMTINWSDEIGTYSITETNPANVCGVPEQPELSITNRCVAGDRIEWAVVNPSNTNVAFDWTMDGGAQSGSETAPANGRVVFLVSEAGRHTVTVTWANNEITRTSSAQRCSPPVSETATTTTTPGTGVTGTPSVGITNIPQTGGTPVPTVSAPGTGATGQGTAVSPVTGSDLNELTTAALIQRLLTNLGLLFLGVALVLTGFGTRLK